MKFTLAWADVAAQNVVLKVALSLTLVLVGILSVALVKFL